MLRCKNQIASYVLLLVLFSCTIIKDSDVTSVSQLNSLSLNSFEIVQNSQAGNSTALATLKYDSVVNRISSGTGAHIIRVKGFSLPALGNYKMKLKSGTNAATEVKIEYRDNGMANACKISQGDSAVEFYTFYYNSSNQLIKFHAILNPIDGKHPFYETEDKMTFASVSDVNPATATRSSVYDATLAGMFTMQSCQNCGTPINPISFNGSEPYQINFFTGGNCDNSNNSDQYIYTCGGVSRNSTAGGSGSNNNQAQVSFRDNFTFDKTLQTSLTSISNTDIYYFHPIMIVKDAVPSGSFYFWFYSVDWFQTSGNSSNNSDMIKINFNYGH